MIKIIIADDLSIIRQGIQAVLEQDDMLKVVGSAADGEEAFRLCKEFRPDVVLMDMKMPGYDGEYGIRKIKEYYPEIKVLVLTTLDDDETIAAAMACSADGYILKEMDSNEIITSVRAVYAGINVFGPNIYSNIQKKIISVPKRNEAQSELSSQLTQRERDIIKLIAEGLDNKNIAAKLFLAEGTVRNNISKMLDKLSLKDRTQLAVFAVKNNIT